METAFCATKRNDDRAIVRDSFASLRNDGYTRCVGKVENAAAARVSSLMLGTGMRRRVFCPRVLRSTSSFRAKRGISNITQCTHKQCSSHNSCYFLGDVNTNTPRLLNYVSALRAQALKVKILHILTVFFLTLCLISCRKEIEIPFPKEEPITNPEFTSIQGFYLLNEGNMGTNKSTLDYFDYEKGAYTWNIYADANPSVPKELGDVGNDIAIYGSKMYAVINCSNKIEVMDAKTAKRIGQINIPNCRYIKFHNGFGYVTSYAGPIQPNSQQIGYVAKIDTTSLQILDQCLVGLQPDGLAMANGKIYVANSGGYLSPNYENTVSVIDIASFKETKRIKVAVNLNRVCADKHGNIWINTRGDYYNTSSKLYCIDSKTDQLIDSVNIVISNFHLDDDKLYIIGVKWNNVTMSNEISYGVVDVVSKQVISNKFITDGTDAAIKMPYGITVNPLTKDIYVTDAGNYVTPGTLYCFGKDGKWKWEVRTGDIPGCFAFIGKF